MFIIAEIGINHNGSIDLATELIHVAKFAGCDAVKFQKRTIDAVYSPEMLASPRESPWGTTQREQKEGLEFGEEEYSLLDKRCRDLGIEWFASAWDLDSQDFLAQYDCQYNKVASAMLVYTDLLEKIAAEGKHTFISTGLSTFEHIDRAVAIFRDASCPFELMHCVSTYPTDAADANLRCIETLRQRYGCDVGLSDHHGGLALSYAAAAFGISSLERHITLDRAMYGSDQSASIEPLGLKQLVGGLRKIELALGDGEKRVLKAEVNIAKKLRAHIPGH